MTCQSTERRLRCSPGSATPISASTPTRHSSGSPTVSDLAPLLAGRRCRRIRGAGRQAGRRPGGDRQLSRQGAHARRAPARRGEGAVAHSGHASLQPARVLRRVRHPARGPRRDRPRTLRRLDRLGEVARHRARLQPDLLLPSEGATTSRSRIPTRRSASFWIRHAAACRRIGAAMGKALGTPCVTNVWIPDGMKDTPVDRRRPAGTADGIAGRRVRRSARPGLQPGFGRRQAVRPRLRELHRRLARVLFRVRAVAQDSLHARHRPLPSDRNHHRQDQRGPDVPPGDPAARQPRRALGQRPRGGPRRRSGRHRAGARPRRLPRSGRTSGWTTSTRASTAWPRG